MRTFILAILFSLCAMSWTLPAHAHELVPKELEEYISEHPQATEADIQAFMGQNTDIFGVDPSYQQRLVASVKNPQTSVLDTLLDFFRLGVLHVLSGTDHVLFVLSLLLVFASWRQMVTVTSTFTVAHSLTLILAALGVVSLTARVVEPLIAFSITYVAITTVFLRRLAFFSSLNNKLTTVFFFGLFHGLGFAGALNHLRIPTERFLSSLIAFNMGVEAAQLIILAIAIPILLAIRHKTWYPRFISLSAAALALVGLVWGVQRIFF